MSRPSPELLAEVREMLNAGRHTHKSDVVVIAEWVHAREQAARAEEHRRTCLYCVHGNPGCARGRALSQPAVEEKP